MLTSNLCWYRSVFSPASLMTTVNIIRLAAVSVCDVKDSDLQKEDDHNSHPLKIRKLNTSKVKKLAAGKVYTEYCQVSSHLNCCKRTETMSNNDHFVTSSEYRCTNRKYKGHSYNGYSKTMVSSNLTISGVNDFYQTTIFNLTNTDSPVTSYIVHCIL